MTLVEETSFENPNVKVIKEGSEYVVDYFSNGFYGPNDGYFYGEWFRKDGERLWPDHLGRQSARILPDAGG
jgi:hypothetical protein